MSEKSAIQDMSDRSAELNTTEALLRARLQQCERTGEFAMAGASEVAALIRQIDRWVAALKVIADGDGDAQEIARQTLEAGSNTTDDDLPVISLDQFLEAIAFATWHDRAHLNADTLRSILRDYRDHARRLLDDRGTAGTACTDRIVKNALSQHPRPVYEHDGASEIVIPEPPHPQR